MLNISCCFDEAIAASGCRGVDGVKFRSGGHGWYFLSGIRNNVRSNGVNAINVCRELGICSGGSCRDYELGVYNGGD